MSCGRGDSSNIPTPGVGAELPSSMSPTTNVYVPVDLCNGTNGRLNIQPNGVVFVQTQRGFNNAKCFTLLDGVSFVQ
jgi:hypothetical protein